MMHLFVLLMTVVAKCYVSLHICSVQLFSVVYYCVLCTLSMLCSHCNFGLTVFEVSLIKCRSHCSASVFVMIYRKR